MNNTIFRKSIKTVELEVYSEFADRLTAARKLSKLTQEALAQKIGITRTALANYEIGKSIPPLPNFVELCTALNVTPNELLGFTAPEKTVESH